MHTADSRQRMGRWAPAVSYSHFPRTSEAALTYVLYELAWDEKPVQEFVFPSTPVSTEERRLAALYATFAVEDHKLAEMGLDDWVRLLCRDE